MSLAILGLQVVVLSLKVCAQVVDLDDILFRLLLYLCNLPFIFSLHDLEGTFRPVLEGIDHHVSVPLQLLIFLLPLSLQLGIELLIFKELALKFLIGRELPLH